MVSNQNAITIIDPNRAIENVKALANIVKDLRASVLKPDLDFGVIPGTGSKPTLLLPGMEKLMRALNAVPDYLERCVIRDYDRPLFHYEYECRLIDCETGVAIPGGRGIGLCTSMESAFRWRQSERVCPNCGKATIIKGKEEYGGGWICFAKKGGCGAKFKAGDTVIESQPVGRIDNPDIFDQVNTIMKRAKKRALGDAIKGAANVSEHFTVDLEDFVRYDLSTDVVDAAFEDVTGQVKPPTPTPSKPATPPQVDNTVADTPTPPETPQNGNGGKLDVAVLMKTAFDKYRLGSVQVLAKLGVKDLRDFKGTLNDALALCATPQNSSSYSDDQKLAELVKLVEVRDDKGTQYIFETVTGSKVSSFGSDPFKKVGWNTEGWKDAALPMELSPHIQVRVRSVINERGGPFYNVDTVLTPPTADPRADDLNVALGLPPAQNPSFDGDAPPNNYERELDF